MIDTLAPATRVGNPGPITRALIFVAGVDQETLRECPVHDWDNVRAIGVLMVFVWVYQTALIVIVAHRILAPDGRLHFALVALGVGLILRGSRGRPGIFKIYRTRWPCGVKIRASIKTDRGKRWGGERL